LWREIKKGEIPKVVTLEDFEMARRGLGVIEEEAQEGCDERKRDNGRERRECIRRLRSMFKIRLPDAGFRGKSVLTMTPIIFAVEASNELSRRD
jgi:hypothetical protein